MFNICYLPQEGIDDAIAAKINEITGGDSWNSYRVATLRGLYDESMRIPLEVDDINSAANKLIGYRESLARKNAKKVNYNFQKGRSSKTLVEVYEELKKAFTPEERINRVNMISTLFSHVVSTIKRDHPELSREDICKGIHQNLSTGISAIGGQFAIFDRVFDEILTYYTEALENEDAEESEKYKKILENWSALVTYAKIRLRDTESIKLGERLEWADGANETNYAEDFSSFNAEEARREAWQEENDKKSAFGSVSQEVRRLLGLTQKYDREGGVYDDLGFPIMLDPVSAHQQLADLLRGVTSESNMMKILNRNTSKHPWLKPIITALEEDHQLKTKFFVDFHKGFQLYSMLIKDVKNGVVTLKTKILNRESGGQAQQYITRVTLGQLFTKKSVFDEEGNVNWKNLQELREIVNKYFVSNSPVIPAKFWTRDISFRDKRNIIVDVLARLGINYDNEALDRIMTKSKELRLLTRNLQELVQYGIDKILTQEELKSLVDGKSLASQSFVDLIKTKTATAVNSREGNIEEKINKIITLIAKNGKELRVEHRAKFKDSKGNSTSYDSYVNPCYLSDRLERIASFVANEDKRGLQKFIEEEFLKSSYFYDKTSQIGTEINPDLILNQWLKELYTSNLEEDSFAANFSFERFLGDNSDNTFENFTSKQHAIAMLEFYLSDRQISHNSQYAHYPIFILGDSGVAKFIKAKRYSVNEKGISSTLLDGMWRVFLQERQRMKLVTAANTKLASGGYATIDNIGKNDNKYTLLSFLNNEEYAAMINENHLEQSVKNAIITYMTEEAIPKFKAQLSTLGVLETKKVGDKEVYVNFGSDVNPQNIDTVIADYYWNNKFAMINQLQFFTIDPGFYKGTKDLQKRYKEIHAPGTSLSIEAKDFNGELYSLDGIERVVYFTDPQLNAEFFNSDFMRAIEHHFKDNPDLVGDYKKNALADGQGYRSLESYRKVRGMAGQWTEAHEKVYNEIMSIRARIGRDEQVSAEDFDRLAELSVIFQPIKPYMFTHERFAINSEDILLIPVQHKYAEAVLIPELLPAGSKLRDMAYYMEDNNIDVLGAWSTGGDKIVKVGGFGATSISDATTRDELYFSLNKGYIHQLNYADYRIQTNVPEHINSSQLFGTQLRKLIMANIKMHDTRYASYVGGQKVNLGGKQGKVTLTGKTLIAFYNSLIMANIFDSYKSFSQEVGDIDKLSELLIQNVISNSRESIDNIIAFTRGDDGNFTLPLFEGGLEHDASALLFSLFKKAVNKQRIKGGSAVQVSAMGIKGYEESGDLIAVTDPDNPTNVLYAECEMPFDLSFTDIHGEEHSLIFSEWCNDDGTPKLGKILDKSDQEYKKYLSYRDSEGNVCKPKIEERFPGILSFIAYRIPTENDYSMINLQIKRFSQKTAGGTIKVPAQYTTISGFDFDIDKLYFMMREFILTEEIDKATNILMEGIFGESPMEIQEYNFDKTPLQNTKAARNNMLIALIQQRLMDEETFKKRYTPGGFKSASKAARVMRELLFGNPDNYTTGSKVNFEKLYTQVSDKASDPEPNYDCTDPMTIITYNQQNQVAGKLIGVFANQNTNHAFASLMESFTLKKPIEFCGHSYFNLLHAPDGVDVDTNVAEFLAASVDAVKDPVLNFLNLNTLTADAGAVLARIGYTTEEIGMLFNQPIIKEICEYSFNSGQPIDIALREIVSKHQNVIATQGVELTLEEKKNILLKEALVNNILNYRWAKERNINIQDNGKFWARQIEIASLFSDIIAAANDISQFVTTSKFTASNAVGSSFGDLYAQQMKVEEYLKKDSTDKLVFTCKVSDRLSSTIMNGESLLTISPEEYIDAMLYNPFGYEQTMFDMNRKVQRLLTKYFPYDRDAYKNSREFMKDLTRSKTLDADTINHIHRDLLVYMLSQKEGSLFNGNTVVNIDGTKMTAREYYTKHFAKRLYSISFNSTYKDLALFNPDYMVFQTDGNGNISVNIQNIGSLQPYQKDALKEGWERLVEINPNLARDLFMYNFYKLGFTFAPLSFMNLAPIAIKQMLEVSPEIKDIDSGEIVQHRVTYIDFLNKVLKGNINVNAEEFTKQFILNHLDNWRFTYRPSGEDLKTVLKISKVNGVVQNTFSLDITGKESDSKSWVIGSRKVDKYTTETFFRPCLIINGSVYMANGDGNTFNSTYKGVMEYIKVSRLGITNQSVQYNSINSKTDNTLIELEPQASTNITLEIPEETPSFNRESAIITIATEYKKAFDVMGIKDDENEPISINTIKTMLDSTTDDTSLARLIEDLKIACRKDGILVLDEEGNMMFNC